MFINTIQLPLWPSNNFTLATCLVTWGLTYGVDGDERRTDSDSKTGLKLGP